MAEQFVSINPATEETFANYAAISSRQLEQRLQRAQAAFASWSQRSLEDRAKFIQKLAQTLRARQSDLARLATLEMGKPITQAQAEVEKCAVLCDYYIEHAEKFLSPLTVSGNSPAASRVRFDPLGGVLAIMPWNFPFWQVFRFAVPALLAGNVGLLKHAANVTGSALAIETLFTEAEFPEGVFATLIVDRDQIPDLIARPEIHAVTLTGSEGAGRAVGKTAGANLKKCVLELGGSDPFIVFPDVDLEKVVQQAVTARTQNCGQSCIAAKRFLVHDDIVEPFQEAFAAALKKIKIGDPLEPGTQMGPMARADLRDGLNKQVEKSVAEGARLLTGGKSLDRPGWFYEPTLLGNVTPEMTAFREETFGPVAAVTSFHTTEEAISLANDSSYGLGASVWTRDLDRANQLAPQLEAGAVFVNEFVKSDPSVPFGGVKNSGYGRELGEFGVREFVNIKTVWVGR